MKQDLRDRVADEIANGRVWRAKEILRGSFSGDFDPDRCEAYGQVLLQMNDLKEAGGYLFVSGARKPEYQAAIAIFMEKFVTLKAKNRLLSLPGRIHRVNIDDWPTHLVDDLVQLGWLNELRKYQNDLIIDSPNRIWVRRLAEMGCATLFIIIIVLAVVGLFTALRTLYSF